MKKDLLFVFGVIIIMVIFGKTKQDMSRNYIVNRDVVRSKMVLKHISVKHVCELLGITDVSFYNKINGKREFTETEICNLVSLFGNSIFFDFCCLEKPKKERRKKQ